MLRDLARTATVRATTETTLLALERDHFITAATGHARSHEAVGSLITARLETPAAGNHG